MAPKKQQQKKMALGDFLSDQSMGSWADEMDSMPLPAPSGFGRPSAGSWSANRTAGGAGAGAGAGPAAASDSAFGGASRLQGYAVREELPLPTEPPYTAHLGNLSFEVTEGDVQDFLSGCDVTNVRIIEDKMDRRPKGFGYVTFGTVEGLKKALTLSESQFQGRNIRVSVADPPKNSEPQRTFDDWSRKGPLPDLPGQGSMRGPPQREGGFNRGGFEQNDGERGERRAGFFEGDGKVRDFSNWERKGPLTPTEPAARQGGSGSMREGRPREEGGFRDRQAGWGEGTGRTADDESRPPRREFADRPPPVERQPTAADMDNQWRTKMRPDAPSPAPPAETSEASTPTSPAAAPAVPAAPTSRPRLNLAKRTVSEAPKEDASADAGAADNKASIFGAARPIDTAAREREIEEKRQLAIRTKKEQQDKEREERRASAAAAKDAAAPKDNAAPAAASSAPKEPKAARGAGAQKQNGKEEDKDASASSLQYEILRRDADTTVDADGDAEAVDANGAIIGDKDIKPREITREVPKSETGGSWRKASAATATEKKSEASPAATPKSTTEAVEDDGWSTVSKKEKNFNKRGGGAVGGGRAVAS